MIKPQQGNTNSSGQTACHMRQTKATGREGKKMKSYAKAGYFTGWQYDDETRKSSHRIYYNDIDIATANLLCDGVVVGNAMNADRHMQAVDKANNYMW